MTNVRQAQLKLCTGILALAMVAGNAAGVRAATASWSPNIETDLAGYKLSYGTQSGVHTVVIDVGKVTTYQFYPPAGRRYYVVVQAYNTAGQLSAKSPEAIVDVPFPNLAPLLAQPANQTTTVNTYVSLALSASDAEGRALTFTATGLPPGLSINSSTRLISGTPGTIGLYQVTVTVSDGLLSTSRSFGWTISGVPNQPPTLAQPANQSTVVNTSVSLTLSAGDPEGKALTLTAAGLPPGLSLASASKLISGRPSTVGSYPVTVRASDGALTTSRSFTWTIVNASLPGTGASDIEISSAQTAASSSEGGATDTSPLHDYVGVPGDFDGDGRLDLATFRLSSREWRIWASGANFLTSTVMVWGEAGDRPMPADYNGDRVTDLGVYRPSTGTWHLWLSGTQTPLAVQWGGLEDTPVAFDHDLDGKADLALIRNGGYEILLSSANFLKSVQVR